MSSESRVGVYFHPASTSCAGQQEPCGLASGSSEAPYLLRLALPSPLSLVRPASGESRLPRFRQLGIRRVVGDVIANARFDRRDKSPAALAGMPQMLLDGVVIGLPAVEPPLTQKTHHVVGMVGRRVEIEAGTRKLPPGTSDQDSHAARHRENGLTLAASNSLWGQDRAFGARPLALEALRFPPGCTTWKEARRPSSVK